MLRIRKRIRIQKFFNGQKESRAFENIVRPCRPLRIWGTRLGNPAMAECEESTSLRNSSFSENNV